MLFYVPLNILIMCRLFSGEKEIRIDCRMQSALTLFYF